MSISKLFDPYRYVVHTERVEFDGEEFFKTSIVELPDVEVYEKTVAEAYSVIIQTIKDLHDAAVHDGRPFPLADKRDNDYSGRVTLRMGRTLHRRLDFQSRCNGNTLNAEIVGQLSETSAVKEVVRELTDVIDARVSAAVTVLPGVVHAFLAEGLSNQLKLYRRQIEASPVSVTSAYGVVGSSEAVKQSGARVAGTDRKYVGSTSTAVSAPVVSFPIMPEPCSVN